MTRARDTANLIGSGNFSSTTFTATSGQTAFTISHTQGFVQVFMNGLLLDETADYTSNGTAITLTSGAAAGDEIEVVAYNTFNVGDAQTQAQADARYVQTTGHTMTGALTVDDDGATPLTVDRATSDGAIIDVQKDGTSVGTVGSYLGTYLYMGSTGGTDTHINFVNGNVRPATAAGAHLDNSLDLGHASSRWKDLYLSGGAYVGGTAAANYLDDYEEGTFNLTLVGYYGNPTTTQTVAGYYTKVGNMVHVCCRAEPLNTTGASGHMWLTGLPFASMTPYTVLSCTMDHMGTYPNSSPMAYCAGSIVYIDKHVNQGARSAVFHNAVTNGALTITGSYRI
jgi:hypothetical protein